MSSQVQTQTKAYDWMPSAAATLQLVQKRSLVSVQLDDGASVEGVLLTVDPCSGDVFLLHPNSQLKQASGGGESSESSSSSSKCALSVVLGHTVRSLAPSSSSASSSGRRKGGDAEQQVERFLKWIASATAAAEAGGGDSRASDWDASKVPDLEARLQHLLALLTRHRIPHTVLTSGQDPSNGDSIDTSSRSSTWKTVQVLEVLSVRPPFTPAACVSSNEMVLRRIQALLAANPFPVTAAADADH